MVWPFWKNLKIILGQSLTLYGNSEWKSLKSVKIYQISSKAKSTNMDMDMEKVDFTVWKRWKWV